MKTTLFIALAVVLTSCGEYGKNAGSTGSKASSPLGHEDREVNQMWSGNPILPGDFADPFIIEYQDTIYIYATTGAEATVWRSSDFVNWKLTKLNWPTSMEKPHIWAPGVVEKEGKFYLYTSVNSNIYVGVAEHPMGPFENLLEGDSIFIQNRQWWEKMHSIDADAFIDDDGTSYLYWGSGFDFIEGQCAVGILGEDMASFKEQPKLITPEGYFEAPHMLKNNEKYYLMYSDGHYYDSTYNVRYAVSDKPTGPFLQGKNSPILKTTEDGRVSGPGHHSTIKFNDSYYIVYHRHVYPFYKGKRQVAIDKLEFEEDGSIKTVIPTEKGVPLNFIENKVTNLPLQPVSAKASSAVDSNYAAGKAFDGSNGTLWATEATNSPSWLQADFGDNTMISSCEPIFDKVMGNYTYSIEYSLDGQSWQEYASGNNAKAQEWPVKHEKVVQARFIRITILEHKQSMKRVGLWELKVY